MNLSDAERLLKQWAKWCYGDDKIGYTVGSWQIDYRTADWDDDSDNILAQDREDVVLPGDEATMRLVDSALSALGRSDAHSLHVLRARYRRGYQPAARELDDALMQFIRVYERAQTPPQQPLRRTVAV